MSEFNSDRWELPHLALYKLSKNSLAFSSKHQKLFSIGGEYYGQNSTRNVSNLYCLDFNEDIDNIGSWHWQSMKTKVGDRRSGSSVIIEKYDKLFIAGGYHGPFSNYDKSISIYNLENENSKMKDGKDCKYGRSMPGIVNNQYNTDEIYLGGGSNKKEGMNIMECYNANKNQWFKLEDMNMKYECHPIVWLESGYQLYIADMFQYENGNGKCEMLDLRDGKQWKIIHNQGDLMKNVFGINEIDNEKCRLVTS